MKSETDPDHERCSNAVWQPRNDSNWLVTEKSRDETVPANEAAVVTMKSETDPDHESCSFYRSLATEKRFQLFGHRVVS